MVFFRFLAHVFLSKNRFGQKNIFVSFGNFLTEENVENHVEEKCHKIQAKKKLGQKLSQKLQRIPSKNRHKIQNNNARAAGGARPIFGVVVLNLNWFLEGSCWSFWTSFCWPGLFDISLRLFADVSFGQKTVKTDKHIFGQIDFSKISSCKNDFSNCLHKKRQQVSFCFNVLLQNSLFMV